MGDVSIIARRMADGRIEYGWAGNGGTLDIMGDILCTYYDTPELVDYLFGLGQMELIAAPHSEDGGCWYRNRPTGAPHWIVQSEDEIFDRILFIDYVYFYEVAEQKWYFIYPRVFSVKVPLSWCVDYMQSYTPEGKSTDQHQCLCKISHDAAFRVCELYEDDAQFRLYCTRRGITEQRVRELMDTIDGHYANDDDTLFRIKDNNVFAAMCRYFDDWMVYDQTTGKYKTHCKTDQHIETINWD